jgi:hypothetical protein
MGEENVGNEFGKTYGIWTVSAVAFTNAVLVPTFLIVFIMASVTALHKLTIILSVLSLGVALPFLSNLMSYNPMLWGVIDNIARMPKAYLSILLSVSLVLIVECTGRFIASQMSPSVTQVARERGSADWRALPSGEISCK